MWVGLGLLKEKEACQPGVTKAKRRRLLSQVCWLQCRPFSCRSAVSLSLLPSAVIVVGDYMPVTTHSLWTACSTLRLRIDGDTYILQENNAVGLFRLVARDSVAVRGERCTFDVTSLAQSIHVPPRPAHLPWRRDFSVSGETNDLCVAYSSVSLARSRRLEDDAGSAGQQGTHGSAQPLHRHEQTRRFSRDTIFWTGKSNHNHLDPIVTAQSWWHNYHG